MKRVSTSSQKQLLWLSTLYEIVREVNSTLGLKSALKIILTKATELLKVERASLMLLDPAEKILKIHLAMGLSPFIVKNTRIKLGEGVSGWVAQKGRPLLIQDISKDKRFRRKEGGRYSTNSLLSVPLKVKGKTIGVLNVNNKNRKEVFTQADLKLLAALSDEAAIAIQNARLYDEVVQANERLKELDKLKSNFVASVSHELRTPLGIIRNILFGIRQEMAGTVSDKQREYLLLVEDNLGRLERLIDNLLDLSKMEAGRFELKKERGDFFKVVRKVIDTFQKKSEEKRVALGFSGSETLPFTYFDQDRMIQVVTNLVDNAIKYTPQGGKVDITLGQKDKTLFLEVKDTGIGISVPNQGRLFEKFRQLGNSPHHEKGVGLGLAIAREIVTLHQGKVGVVSEEGKGSSFTVMLPILTDEAFFLDRLSEEAKKVEKLGESLSLVILELANFEQMKGMGEVQAQQLLDQVVSVIRETVRKPSDIVASYKRGKVIAILAGADRQGAEALARRVKEALKRLPLELRFVIGTYPDENRSPSDLIQQAKEVLYGGE